MYFNDSRLNTGSISDIIDRIAQDEANKYAQNNSVAGALSAQPNQPQNKPLASKLPSGSAGNRYAQQIQPNNPSIGYLGGEGNIVSALTGLNNMLVASKNQKDAEDKQLLGQLFQGLGNAGGGIGSLAALSDRRLKENIVPVGKLNNGLTVYLFNYIGQKTPQIGLIAQEVQEVIPEAVIKGEDGFLRVNYAIATKEKKNDD